jgi:hypothetical protein
MPPIPPQIMADCSLLAGVGLYAPARNGGVGWPRSVLCLRRVMMMGEKKSYLGASKWYKCGWTLGWGVPRDNRDCGVGLAKGSLATRCKGLIPQIPARRLNEFFYLGLIQQMPARSAGMR